ncbi:hypothetical protein V5O48_008228 [Marasmius crinis-equi]|uniref:Duf1665 domain containing protein n=1 Tax=Marasmius crinis-equi TaxID=585013 RepID=A0ABR3FEV5_9AGAR
MTIIDTASESAGIKLPGFGLPVNTLPYDCIDWQNPDKTNRNRLCFPNAITEWAAANLLVREQTMLTMINEITDKPEWDRKVNDEAIIGRWKMEALSQKGVDFSEAMFDYCIAELRDKAPRFTQTGRVTVLDSLAAIVKSDTAIPSSIADELKAAVKPLENVPTHQKDWHPGSDDKVLDLVHPSLYPLMYGKSRVLPSDRIVLTDCLEACGKGVIIPKPPPEDVDLGVEYNRTLSNGLCRIGYRDRWRSDVQVLDYWSDSYQWLPCEVAFRDEDEVEITSYINNLHPRHAALYGVLEKVIAKTIPLWNDCLSYFGFSSEEARYRIVCGDDAEYEYPLGRERPRDEDEDLNDDERYDRDEEWLRDNRVLIQPEPEDYKPYDREILSQVDLRKDWKEQGLQIVIKLANIELSPESGKTSYEGGTWHVEGQLNEHICASAIYYYDQSNITESRLAFRQLTDREPSHEKDYEQGDYSGLETLYGIEQYGPCLQNLGSVVTREGRLLVFPNVLQHQVQPFKLTDPTKPGYRKILALFLVDPYIRTLSTANVPPQQREWWAEVVRRDDSTRLGKLPAELKDQVVRMTDEWPDEWPISLEEAKRVREDLMLKRRMYVDKVNQDFEQEGFSFCEH